MPSAADLATDLIKRADASPRFMVAIAGPPGSGKTTLSVALCEALKAQNQTAGVVPMDGFHFDDIVLNARGHRARKGAAHTFDASGFEVLLKRIKTRESDIAIPVFDRHMELSRAAADIVPSDTRFVIVEGLYLFAEAKSLDQSQGTVRLYGFPECPPRRTRTPPDQTYPRTRPRRSLRQKLDCFERHVEC